MIHQRGHPNSWMVYCMENPIEILMIWGYPHFKKPLNDLLVDCCGSLVVLRSILLPQNTGGENPCAGMPVAHEYDGTREGF